MKKNLFLIWSLVGLLGLFASCEEDLPGVGKGANETFSGDNLTLTYGGNEMLGKQVTFHTYDGEKATLTLNGTLDLSLLFPSESIPEVAGLAPGVVPGEVITTISNVPLTLSEDGSTYTFFGTDTQYGRTLTYSGEASAERMTLTLDVVMPENDLVGTWNFPQTNGLSMKWDSDATINVSGMEIPTSTAAGMVGPVLSPMLAQKVQSFTFGADGNISVTYRKNGTDTWQTSPLNLAMYYVMDGRMYLQLNVTQIIATAQSTRADISSLLSLLQGLVDYLSEGIPLTYSADGNALTLTLGTEETKAILNLLTIDFVLEKIEGLIPEDYQSIVTPILEKLPEILDSTTTLELSLHLEK